MSEEKVPPSAEAKRNEAGSVQGCAINNTYLCTTPTQLLVPMATKEFVAELG
jgi:hypothetical protein